jgi:hypothetical protein
MNTQRILSLSSTRFRKERMHWEQTVSLVVVGKHDEWFIVNYTWTMWGEASLQPCRIRIKSTVWKGVWLMCRGEGNQYM